MLYSSLTLHLTGFYVLKCIFSLGLYACIFHSSLHRGLLTPPPSKSCRCQSVTLPPLKPALPPPTTPNHHYYRPYLSPVENLPQLPPPLNILLLKPPRTRSFLQFLSSQYQTYEMRYTTNPPPPCFQFLPRISPPTLCFVINTPRTAAADQPGVNFSLKNLQTRYEGLLINVL